jgi:hypothetical protein
LALTQVYQEQSATLLKEIVAFTKEPVNQWDLVKKLFSSDKAAQSKYFAQLSQQFNFYEIIGIAKTTLFLIMAILKARQERLDNISIATKLKKSSFYIESLYRTSTDCSITFEKALSLTTRLMNLELSLKSGKFDDEKFGFDILLATL